MQSQLQQQVQPGIPPRPVRPQQPDAYRRLVAEVNATRRNLAKSRAAGIDLGTLLFDDAIRAERKIQAWLATDAGLAYARAVREYNDLALTYNRALAAARQAALNAQEAQKVRTQMCPKCFTVHRPEVECT